MLKIIISYRMEDINRSLQIALVGYGKMGQKIAAVSCEREHAIEIIIDPLFDGVDGAPVINNGTLYCEKNSSSLVGANLKKENIDVIIDFSTAKAVKQNVSRYCALGIPVVIGTTGWAGQGHAIPKRLAAAGVPCVYGSNFSIGIYLFSKLAAFATKS